MKWTPVQDGSATEAGFVLIEVLVSALVVVIASAGVITLLQTTVRSQAQGRNASEAYALAQEDQARLASMRLADLNRLDETRTITLNNIQFNVRSTGVFINDTTATPSCGEGNVSADYVQISSTVTWPRMTTAEKAKIVSILSPSNGSLDPNNGSIAISVKTQQLAPLPNVEVSGAGGAFKGFTDATGCVVFADVPAGDYVVTVSGAPTGLVGKDGNSATQEKLTVVGGDAKTFNFEFGVPGAIPVNFNYRVGSSGTFATAKADSIIVFNEGMAAAKVLSTPGLVRQETVEATSLFPFTSTYLLYAGSCAANNPDPAKNPAAVANVVAPAGGVASAATIQLPALELIVKNNGSLLKGARVTIADDDCDDANGDPVKRVYTSNENGLPSNSSTGPAELGVPWGVHDLCASANISGSNRRKKVSNVSVKNLAGATTVTIDLGSGTESLACS